MLKVARAGLAGFITLLFLGVAISWDLGPPLEVLRIASLSVVSLFFLPWAIVAGWGAWRREGSLERRSAWVAVVLSGIAISFLAYHVDEPTSRWCLIEWIGVPAFHLNLMLLETLQHLGVSRWRIELVESPLIVGSLIINPIAWCAVLICVGKRSAMVRRWLLVSEQ